MQVGRKKLAAAFRVGSDDVDGAMDAAPSGQIRSFLIELGIFEGAEVAVRHDADHLAVRYHGHVSKTANLHHAQCFGGVVSRRKMRRLACHHRIRRGLFRVTPFGEQAHSITASEDALKVPLVVYYQDSADAVLGISSHACRTVVVLLSMTGLRWISRDCMTHSFS